MMQERVAKESRFWKEPLLHFFVLGLVVFGLRAWVENPEQLQADTHLDEITSADIDWYRTMWKKRMGCKPTVTEIQRQLNQLIRDQSNGSRRTRSTAG
jgi:hypothetical protein